MNRLAKLSGGELAQALKYREEEAVGQGHAAPKVALRRLTVVLANLEVADKLRVASLPSIPLFASVGGAGGGFHGVLSPSCGASA